MMVNWYMVVKKDQNKLIDAINFFYAEYEKALEEVDLKKYLKLNQAVASLSSYFEKRLSQRCEIDAIYDFFELKQKEVRIATMNKIVANNPRTLNSTDMKMYIEGQPEMIAVSQVLTELNLIRGRFDSLIKAFEVAHWQVSNLVKLQVAGLDEALIPV